jgi:hypothetical protein
MNVRLVRKLLGRLPPLAGEPISITYARRLRDRRGAIHAGAFLRTRRITFDCTPAEFPRIFVHELFHFVWLRAGNPMRRAFEELLERELRACARGELGWSSEWRKAALTMEDAGRRTRRWREYCCESFCDTAAWMYSGVGRHEEFTLEGGCRQVRRAWFQAVLGGRVLSI